MVASEDYTLPVNTVEDESRKRLNVAVPLRKGDWESRVITDLPSEEFARKARERQND